MRDILRRHEIKIGGQMTIGEFGRLFSVGVTTFAIGLMAGYYGPTIRLW